jgi:thiol-disulfide isomerase/thioredoxin
MRLLCFSLLILTLLLNGCHDSNSDSSNSATIDSHGQPVNLLMHPNRWLIINYWATWCHPCQKEIAELDLFYSTHRQKVMLYGVEYDHLTKEQLQKLSKRMSIDYPMLLEDPATLLKLPPVTTLPITYVFSPDGKLHKTLQGPQTQETLKQAIDE